jgi:hypothetical protein
MKRAIIDATLPELKGKFGRCTARGEGSSNKVAISRAVADLFKQVKKKQVSVLTCRITLLVITKCQLCGYEVCRCCEETNKESA